MIKPKVAIQYGIATGERQGVRFRKALRQAGYEITRNPSEADIIIAHSAGCFWLPQAPTHQKLMLIDPLYWPGKTVGERGRHRVKTNFQFRKYRYKTSHWLARNLWGIFYALRDIGRTREIFTLSQHYDLPTVIHNHKAILVRNHDDDWLTSDLDHLDQANPSLIIKHLPGDHEDCWYNPQPYVNLLSMFTD